MQASPPDTDTIRARLAEMLLELRERFEINDAHSA
jgi:hypothetical protein